MRALKEFGGASPAFRLPIQTSASTTWLGEEMPKQEERAEAMAFQIDGWKEGQAVLTKEEVFALNKRMILARDQPNDKQLWLGTPDRLHQLNVEDIGGILTLSVFQSQYLGTQPEQEDQLAAPEQTVIICSARPSGTKDGSKFLLHDNSNQPNIGDTQQQSDNRYMPSGFAIPKAVNPILAIASCQTRATSDAKMEDWYNAIRADHILFPRGDELLQPVVLVFHSEAARHARCSRLGGSRDFDSNVGKLVTSSARRRRDIQTPYSKPCMPQIHQNEANILMQTALQDGRLGWCLRGWQCIWTTCTSLSTRCLDIHTPTASH
ncbi:hypothetical protein MPSEU_001107100 [Mayamaea pseudoterrestris]|nr:hypothetical protein MPSEU_001107100 [Mayamaea pseudoterrestris]